MSNQRVANGILVWKAKPYITPLLIIRTVAVYVVGVLVLLLDLTTWDMRFMQQNDNALLETFDYAAHFIPKDAPVLTDECIGSMIQQPYYKLDTHQDEKTLRRARPAYLILYQTTTQRIPSTPALDALLAHSSFMTQITGFKEDISIYQVEPGWAVEDVVDEGH